jgi:anti-anti-sigma regulatory factor
MGIGALVKFRNELSHSGGRVVFAALRPLVLDTFRHAGLLRIFAAYPTVQEAIASSQAPVNAPPTSPVAPK